MPPFHCPLKDIQIQLPGPLNLKSPQPLLGQRNFIIVQIKRLWRIWYTGKHEIAKDCNGDGEYTVNNKKPAPARHAADAGEVSVCGCLEVAAYHTPQRVADEPHAGAFEEFGAGVP